MCQRETNTPGRQGNTVTPLHSATTPPVTLADGSEIPRYIADELAALPTTHNQKTQSPFKAIWAWLQANLFPVFRGLG